MRAYLALLVGAVSLAGCGASGEKEGAALDPRQGCGAQVGSMTVSPAEVDAGGLIELAVENSTTDSDLTFGLAGAVERAGETGWEPADEAVVQRPIIEIAVVVAPGDVSDAPQDEIALQADADPGQYRVVKHVTATARGTTAPEQATLCAGFTVAD